MGLVIIFGLVAILAGYGTYTSFKNKNVLGLVLGASSFLIFGWFAVMTVLKSGYAA